MEHRCAGERARGEGCASQRPRQSPLGKLSPSRIEVSFPRFFPRVVRFVGCHHSITPWDWPGAQGRSEVSGPKITKGPDLAGPRRLPEGLAYSRREGEGNQDGKGLGIHAAAGQRDSLLPPGGRPPIRKHPLASKGGWRFGQPHGYAFPESEDSPNTTDCRPVISNFFRHRGFLHCIKSSRRVM